MVAGFPSMHAAMAVLPAFISVFVFRSFWTRAISIILAAAVCISIVTAKEHWAIDVPAGIVLGLGMGWVWRSYVWIPWQAVTSVPTKMPVDAEFNPEVQ